MNQRFVEVDAARLLLVVYYFAVKLTDETKPLRCTPKRDVSRIMSREYHLQKLDFLVRNPTYLAYELIELHRLGEHDASDVGQVMTDVRYILKEGEPELRTDPYRRFWRGAYENIDRVKNWWHSRGIIYTEIEPRGEVGSEARPITHFFLTPKGEQTAQDLIVKIESAAWYSDRIRLIHGYFKSMPPARLKDLQYSHESYRNAQLDETIPDLSMDQVTANFLSVFGEEMEAHDGE